MSEPMSEEKLKKLYYNPKEGFLSMTKLWRKVKEQNIPVSQNENRRFHSLQSVQLDIMIYDRFQYHNYKYVIGVIDVYSRYVACRPLTNMRMETIMEKLKEMFDKDLGGYPLVFSTRTATQERSNRTVLENTCNPTSKNERRNKEL